MAHERAEGRCPDTRIPVSKASPGDIGISAETGKSRFGAPSRALGFVAGMQGLRSVGLFDGASLDMSKEVA